MCTLNICIDIDGTITMPISNLDKGNRFSSYSNAKTREKADEIINILFKFHNIFMITERDKSFELITNQYLNYYHIPYNKVIFLENKDKESIATEKKCDIFIEDCYEDALKIAEKNIKVLLISDDVNIASSNNIITVSNWVEIYKFINNYTMKKEGII